MNVVRFINCLILIFNKRQTNESFCYKAIQEVNISMFIYCVIALAYAPTNYFQ